MFTEKTLKTINEEHFNEVLKEVFDQVFAKEGKGYKRHGLGTPLKWQPAFLIARSIGSQFLTGQSVKKLMELKVFEDYGAWKREAVGAVVYIVFAIMWQDFIEQEKTNEKQE